MFLRRIRFESFRSFRDLAIDLTGDPELDDDAERPRRWTLLLGQNGTGKSSVLRGIALALAGSEALPALLGDPSSWVRSGAPRCAITVDVETAEREPRGFRLEIERGDTTARLLRRNAEGLRALDAAHAHASRSWFTVGYGASRRPHRGALAKRGRGTHSARGSERARSVATLFDADATLVPLEAWALDLYRRDGADGLKAIRSALRKLLPGVRFEGIDARTGRLLFKTPDGTVPFDQLDDGVRNVASWCGDLLYRVSTAFEDRREPLKVRGLLLVDELDLHLHPLWQQRLRGFLAATLPNLQIVATSNSLLTVQQFGAHEVGVLRRTGKEVGLRWLVGAPNRLLLHQLLEPAFEIASAESMQIAEKKARYRTLRDKKGRRKDEREQLAKLRAELADAPDPARRRERSATDRRALARVEAALARIAAKKAR